MTQTHEDALTTDQEEIIDYILYASSGLSMIGSLFIIFTFIVFKETRTFGTKLIFFLSISDFFTSLSWFPWDVDQVLCIIQASTLQFFEIASYLWSFTISLSLFEVFFLEREDEPKKWFLLHHIINWGFPLVSVVVCVAFHKFGKAGGWCWIPNPVDYFRLLVYGPMALVLIFIIVSFILIRFKTQRIQSDFNQALNRKLSFYLLAFVTSQIPAFLNRIQNFVFPDHPLFPLFVLQAIFQPLQGFFNALVYGFNEEHFVEYYARLLAKWRGSKCYKSCCYYSCCTCCAPKKRANNKNGKAPEEIPIFDYDYSSDED